MGTRIDANQNLSEGKYVLYHVPVVAYRRRKICGCLGSTLVSIVVVTGDPRHNPKIVGTLSSFASVARNKLVQNISPTVVAVGKIWSNAGFGS